METENTSPNEWAFWNELEQFLPGGSSDEITTAVLAVVLFVVWFARRTPLGKRLFKNLRKLDDLEGAINRAINGRLDRIDGKLDDAINGSKPEAKPKAAKK